MLLHMVGFLPGVAEQLGFYVYVLIDPRNGRIFYVGKGTGNRCFSHVVEARRTDADVVDDYKKLDQIREIEAAGRQVRIDVLRHGLGEREAFLVESAAIDALGLTYLTNRAVGHDAVSRGRMSVDDVNALYAAPVTIDPAYRVVLIRINRGFRRGMGEGDLYEVTRKFWRVGGRRRQLGSKWAPEWAMAVFGGIVRAVYRIEDWEQPSAAEIAENPRLVGRWAFRGKRDPMMEGLYLHRDVSSHLRNAESGNPSQVPIRYVGVAR
jgi:hypothetical protein